MSKFLAAVRSDFRTPAPFVIWIFLTFLVGLAGPFGTYPTFDVTHRLVFWGVSAGVCIGIGSMVRALVYTVLNLRGQIVGFLLAALILAALLPIVIFWLISVFLGPAYLHAPGHLEMTLFVFFTSLAISAYRKLSGHDVVVAKPSVPVEGEASDASLPDTSRPDPRLIRRLPPELRGALVSISVRDHYIDVTTEFGQASLLMRLSDAVHETDSIHGAQVHRSHWVAWDAVTDIERKAEKLHLVMLDGSRVPVSKTYRALVEARGIGTTLTL